LPDENQTPADPLSYGVYQSCKEAAWLAAQVQAVHDDLRGSAAGKRRRRGTASAASAAAGGGDLTLLKPEDTVAWCWGKYLLPTQFILGPVRHYHEEVAVQQYTDLARLRHRESAVHDPRDCVNYTIRNVGWDERRSPQRFLTDPVFALNHIFTWDAALCYFTDGLRAEQRDRCMYFAHAAPVPHVNTRAARQVDEEGELDDAHDNNDDNGIGALAEAAGAAASMWPAHARHTFQALKHPIEGGTVGKPVTWPFRGTTYVVNPHFVACDILAQVLLPHALGKVLTQTIQQQTGVVAEIPRDGMKEFTLCVKLLRQYESEQRAHAHDPMLAAGSAAPSFNISPEAAEAGVQGEQDIQRLQREERDVVELALYRLKLQASAQEYSPLLQPGHSNNVVQSTSREMGTLDFAPEQYLLGASVHEERSMAAACRVLWLPTVQAMMRDEFTPEQRAKVMNQLGKTVDVIDPDFVRADAMLVARLHNQAQRGANRLLSRNAATQWATTRANMVHFDRLVRQSDQLPESVKGALRTYLYRLPEFAAANAQHMAAVAVPTRASASVPAPVTSGGAKRLRPKHTMRGQRPMTMMMQELADVLCFVKRASPQTFVGGLLAYFSGQDCWTYAPNRSFPALNILFLGDTATGKSFMLRHCMQALMVPGIVQDMSNCTTNAFMTSTNWDHVHFMFEEAPSKWLFATGSDKDKGSTDAINFTKQRLTNFSTEVNRGHINDVDGVATTVKSKSSHHNNTSFATNQNPDGMEGAMLRRLMPFFHPRHVGLASDGYDPNGFSALADPDMERLAIDAWHEINACFAYVMLAVKSGVVPPIETGAAEMQLNAILADLQRNRFVKADSATKRHQVMQLAIIIQVTFACWQALRGPLSEALLPGAKRWQAVPMLEVTTPFVAPTKEALVVAMTLLEFNFTPVYVEYMLRAIATECVHLERHPREWPFRSWRETDGSFRYDCNYVVIAGKKQHKEIAEEIKRFIKEYDIRAEDLLKFLSDLQTTYVQCERIESTGGDPAAQDKNRPLDIRRQQAGVLEPLKALFFEDDEALPQNRRGQRLCISIGFLEQRLDCTAGDADSVNALRMARRGYDPSAAKSAATLDALGSVDAERCSPVAASVQSVLGSRVLEYDPALAPWLRDSTPPLPFCTGYVPEPIAMFERDRDRDAMVIDAMPEQRRTRNVFFHGMFQTMTLQRGDHVLRQENTLRPTPAAKRSFGDMSRDHLANSQLSGVVAGKCDVDSTMMRRWQRTLCHPGLPQLNELFFRGTALEGKEEALRVELPYNFGPVLNRIYEQHAAAEARDMGVYPREAMLERVTQALQMLGGAGGDEQMRDIEDLVAAQQEQQHALDEMDMDD